MTYAMGLDQWHIREASWRNGKEIRLKNSSKERQETMWVRVTLSHTPAMEMWPETKRLRLASPIYSPVQVRDAAKKEK